MMWSDHFSPISTTGEAVSNRRPVSLPMVKGGDRKWLNTESEKVTTRGTGAATVVTTRPATTMRTRPSRPRASFATSARRSVTPIAASKFPASSGVDFGGNLEVSPPIPDATPAIPGGNRCSRPTGDLHHQRTYFQTLALSEAHDAEDATKEVSGAIPHVIGNGEPEWVDAPAAFTDFTRHGVATSNDLRGSILRS